MHSFFLYVFLITCVFIQSVKAAPYIVFDGDTGEIYLHHQAYNRWYPASLTKLMTAYISFKAIAEGKINFETPVILSKTAANEPPSHSGYKAGTILTLHDALAITMVKSANDLATAIAEAVGGTKNAFVQEMNHTAQELGMSDTHFTSANGLPNPRNYSTARDLAILVWHLRREFPQYLPYFSIPSIDYNDGRAIEPNSNKLIGHFFGIDGMKTGFTCASGYNLIASATRYNHNVIAIILGKKRPDLRENHAAELLEYGFNSRSTPSFTLFDLKPYGKKRRKISNLRKYTCTKEAYQLQAQHLDRQGNTIPIAPFINPRQNGLPVFIAEPLFLPSASNKSRP